VILRGFGAGARGETAARGGLEQEDGLVRDRGERRGRRRQGSRGSGDRLVAARIDLADDLSASDVAELAHQIGGDLRNAVPAVDEVFLDRTGRKD
jgi:hypothetical protein